jgi:hypothetical protein
MLIWKLKLIEDSILYSSNYALNIKRSTFNNSLDPLNKRITTGDILEAINNICCRYL